jgi:hypothetical protein
MSQEQFREAAKALLDLIEVLRDTVLSINRDRAAELEARC